MELKENSTEFCFEDKIRFTKAVFYNFRTIPLPKPFRDATGGMGMNVPEQGYLELWDEESPGSWAVAFFDEVITLYDEIPDYKTMVDVVKDGNSNNMVEIPWQRTLNVFH